jgi:hypothetical protein
MQTIHCQDEDLFAVRLMVGIGKIIPQEDLV